MLKTEQMSDDHLIQSAKESSVLDDYVVMIMAIAITIMMGRVNYGKPYIFPSQRKGLWEGDILLDDIVQVGVRSLLP